MAFGGLSIRGLYQIRVRAKKAETSEYKAATGYQVMFTTNKNGSGAAKNINQEK